MTSNLHPGASVRLVNDPGRIGTLTDRSRRRGNTTVYQVRFVESASWYPEYELEPADGDALDVFDLLHKRRFGRVRDLRRNLTRIQLSGRLADMVYSMEATNTDFYAYQYKPVIAMLESPSNGLLIADEVGLGKTIEAGLIWTELRARYDARRLVIVCPSMLREKWRDELDRRFGVQGRIVNADELRRELEKPRVQARDGQALIGSMEGLRPPRGWSDTDKRGNARAELARFLDNQAEEAPLIDLLVVDEAHYLRNPESQTARLGALMCEVSEHVALLSATPINLRDRDLYQLLNLADPDSFSDEHTFPLVLQANEPLQRARQVVLQRDAEPQTVVEALELASESPILSGNRQLGALLSSAGTMADEMGTVAGRSSLADRIERINPLRHVITRTRKRDVHERRVVREPHPEFVPMTEAERDFYQRVTEAIRDYALPADINAGFLLASPQRQVASCMAAAARHWGAPAADADDTSRELTYGNFGSAVGNDSGGNETGASPLISHLAGRVLPHVNVVELEAHDSKFARFSALLGEFLREYPGEKVVLFSYFRDTLRYLLRRLGDLGISGELLMGGMRETKQQIIDRFRTNDVQVLISSEVAAEGVDMQFCRLLINYDLPWNPMRVEQRIGRLDRIGQKANRIGIWNLGYADTIDERIYHRLFERLKLFERALGGMEAVLGEATRQLTLNLLADRLTPEQEQQRIDQTALAVENRRREEERLENEASSLIAHGGRILEQIHEARDFHHRVTSDDLLIFVRDYLERYHAGFELTPDGDDVHRFRLQLPRELCGELDEFLRRRHLLGQTHLATNDVVNCVFANKVTAATRQSETISQFHPLVRFITEDLRKRDERDYPLVGMMLGTEALPKGIAEGDYVFAVRRWTFSGLRTEEVLESVLLPVGASFDQAVRGEVAMQIVHLARLHGSDWEDPSSEHAVEILEGALDDCQRLLEEAFNKARESWQYENEDRVNFQKDTAARHRDRQLGQRKDTLEKYQASGRTRLVPAMKGQLRNIERRFEANIARLDAQARATASHDDVCYGMLRLGGKNHEEWTENHPQDPA